MAKAPARTKPKTRAAKPAKAQRLPSVRCLDLGARPGAFASDLSLGHKGTPPKIPSGFGESRFSPEMQAANPDKPLTRVVKDVLPVGSWKVGYDDAGQPIMWDVTREQLELIRDQFALSQTNGVAFNLAKSHGDLESLIIPTDDIISPIDQVIVENDVLWISSYVTPQEAVRLQNPAMKVSPGVTTRFADGKGKPYPIMLYHVAVTDQPTVTSQGPFLALANTLPEGGNPMDETILELFKKIFEYEEMPLPESVTTENAMDILTVLVDQLVGIEEEEDSTDSSDGDTGTSTDTPADSTVPGDLAAMTNAIKKLTERLDGIEVGGKKAAFEGRVAGLVAAGKIQAKSAIALNNAAPSHGYNQSILDVFNNEPAKVPLGRQSVRMSNPSAPAVGEPAKKPKNLEDRVAELLGKKAKK